MKPFILLIALLLLAGCMDTEKSPDYFITRIGNDEIKVILEQVTDSTYRLTLEVNDTIRSRWPLRYPVFCFDHGDVTGNGMPDIAVGVIKGTRFFPEPDKRPFLFRISDDYYIRPLWLGSRVGQPLEDFRLVQTESPALIRTIEKEQNGTFLVAEYRWKGFGIEFIRYLDREIPLKQAKQLFQANP